MATVGREVIHLAIFFLISIYVTADIIDTFSAKDGITNPFIMKQDLTSHTNSRIKKRSLRRQLFKRDAGSQDSVCSVEETTFTNKLAGLSSREDFARKFSLQNETKYSMALIWAGENSGRIIIVTTEEFFIFAKPSTLYLSTDDGKTFTEINSRINNAYIRKDNGLQKSPISEQRIYIVAHNTNDQPHSDLYISENQGDSFEQISLPFLLEDSIMFHPTEKDYLLARSQQNLELYLSKDGGKHWNLIRNNVRHFKWSTDEEDPKETNSIYVTRDPNYDPTDTFADIRESFDYTLEKSTSLGQDWSQVLDHVYTFGMQGKFLYASIRQKNEDYGRIMKVSTDGGNTWNEAQLPTITSDRFYAILDMSEDLIFMHVDNPGDTGHGTLYVSDGTGIIFSSSLEKHLYPNFHDLTDFYKVDSMRGVYLASQMSDDNSIHTMITYDRGGEWKPITRPEGVPCKDETKKCYLQIHNQYSISRGVSAQPPLSIPSTIGIIMVHGHVADALQTTEPDVFVSSDGGYTWIKALDGPHHYQIADQGGLLVAIPANEPYPDTLKFSTDEGRCWHDYKFTDEKISFTGLLTEPGNRAMSVSIWGFGAEDRIWRVNTVDFTAVIDTQCQDSDYENWMAHGDNSDDADYKGCLLGVKETFQRLKPDSWCANGHERELTAQKTQEFCKCTKDDYDCDFGYHRFIGSENCVENPEFKGGYLDICFRGHKEEIVTEGYRKIPGDKCEGEGGFKPEGKTVDMKAKCKDGSKNVILSEIDPAYLQETGQSSGHRPGNVSVIVAVILTTLLLAVITVAYFVKKYNLLKRANVTYRYSSLNQSTEYDYDNDFENALATHTSLYQDSSDEEITQLKHSSGAGVHSSTRNNGSLGQTRQQNGAPATPRVKSYHDDSDDDLLE